MKVRARPRERRPRRRAMLASAVSTCDCADIDPLGGGISVLKPALRFVDLRSRNVNLSERLAVILVGGGDVRLGLVDTRLGGVDCLLSGVELRLCRLQSVERLVERLPRDVAACRKVLDGGRIRPRQAEGRTRPAGLGPRLGEICPGRRDGRCACLTVPACACAKPTVSGSTFVRRRLHIRHGLRFCAALVERLVRLTFAIGWPVLALSRSASCAFACSSLTSKIRRIELDQQIALVNKLVAVDRDLFHIGRDLSG